MRLTAGGVPKTRRDALAYIEFCRETKTYEQEDCPSSLADWPAFAPVEMPDDPTAPLTTRQAAQALNVTTEQLLAHVSDGTLRAINISRGKKRGRYRFTRADLDEFKASRMTQEQPCRFSSPKSPRRTTGTASRSSVVDFSALRAARHARKPSGLKR
jgi:excisionase family DNA binding protein